MSFMSPLEVEKLAKFLKFLIIPTLLFPLKKTMNKKLQFHLKYSNNDMRTEYRNTWCNVIIRM